jgi:hypothetical protein
MHEEAHGPSNSFGQMFFKRPQKNPHSSSSLGFGETRSQAPTNACPEVNSRLA